MFHCVFCCVYHDVLPRVPVPCCSIFMQKVVDEPLKVLGFDMPADNLPPIEMSVFLLVFSRPPAERQTERDTDRET